jgi:hypothetical protein
MLVRVVHGAIRPVASTPTPIYVESINGVDGLLLLAYVVLSSTFNLAGDTAVCTAFAM